ncbi:MAG: hypothetical protein ABI411_14890 [Tahibacter sp.]
MKSGFVWGLATAVLPLAGVAAVPAFRGDVCPVRLDGVRLGADLTPGGSSLRNSIVYEPVTRLFHLWVLANNDSNFPTTSALAAFTHATSTDGIHFRRDGELRHSIASVPYASYGATIDPPLDFVRVAFDQQSGTWKLFGWTENVGASTGQYNYNTSVNELGSVASNTVVLHQGPLNTPFAGNHVGAFGLVDGKVYLRVDSLYPDGSGGGGASFAYSDGLPSSTGALLNEANLFTGTPYCWGLGPDCGGSDPRIPAYVHNVGRTLRQQDGSLATYYAFRKWDGSRADQQVWMVESIDNGASWSAPVGVFANSSAITLAGQPLSANFSHVETVIATNVCRTYFSSKDAAGNFVMVSATTYGACDSLFANGFEGCD